MNAKENTPDVAFVIWASTWLVSIVLYFCSHTMECEDTFRGECMEGLGIYVSSPWIYLVAKILFGIGALAIISIAVTAVKNVYFSEDSSDTCDQK